MNNCYGEKMVRIGIIGGSGLEDPRILKDARAQDVNTAFGPPSSELIFGTIEGVEVVIISRHGKGHTIMPTNVPYQANIQALKEAGCSHILATTACGSLKEEIKPGEFVLIDQFIDRTTKRKSTLYETDHVCHIPMAEPFCSSLRKLLFDKANELNIKCHEKGTAVTIEGPRFSTKAESHVFRQWNADVINMTTVPEAVLAREAGLHYCAIAMATDYDCWKEGESVDIECILRTLKENVENVTKLITAAISDITEYQDSCSEDIKGSLMS
jgi:5'-methylthioadenosine phosphorylase